MKKIRDFFIVLFGGPFGLHKFINKEFGMGILYLFTGGIFLIGWFKDVINASKNLFNINEFSSLMSYNIIKQINNGDLPCIDTPNLNLEGNEFCCYMDKGYTFKDKTITTGYTGKNNGVSIRIAKGISYRTGASGNKAIRETQRTKYFGTLYLTTKRLIYSSQKVSFDKPHEKITSIQEAKDGLIIQIGSNTYEIVINTHSEFMKVYTNYILSLIHI